MRLIDRIVGALPWLVAPIMVAGAVHIASLLLIPTVAVAGRTATFAASASSERMTLLPAVGPDIGAPLFEDPATVLSICRFDLTAAPMRLSGTLVDDRMMLFSFHTRAGTTFYSMSDRGAPRGKLDVLLLTQAQLDAVENAESDEGVSRDLRIVAPDTKGFVLVRSFVEQPSDLPLARERAVALSCGPERSRS